MRMKFFGTQFSIRAARKPGEEFHLWIPWPVRTIDNNGYVLELVGGSQRTVPADTNGQCDFLSDGRLYCRKDAKNSGQWRFLSARENEHGRFRALFAGTFWPKMQNGRTSPKNKKLSSPIYRKGRRGRKGKELTADDADERGLGERREPVRWKPEGREAYEASFSNENCAATGHRMEAGATGDRTERTLSKCTPFWDHLGCGGRPREGEGPQIWRSGDREIG